MEAHNATQVESITELNAGDTVTVKGNGADVTHEVTSRGTDAAGREFVAFTVDGFTYTLRDSEPHPLTTGGIRAAGIGAVTVGVIEQ